MKVGFREGGGEGAALYLKDHEESPRAPEDMGTVGRDRFTRRRTTVAAERAVVRGSNAWDKKPSSGAFEVTQTALETGWRRKWENRAILPGRRLRDSAAPEVCGTRERRGSEVAPPVS